MAVTTTTSNETVINTRRTLRKAVKTALERKKKLGQYSVIWRDNQIISQGEDAPQVSQQD